MSSRPTRAVLLGEPWVLWRGDDGAVRAFADRCPHRRTPLSLGSCDGTTITCGYHGWRFDGQGRCVEIPSLGLGATVPPRAQLQAPAGVAEAHGMIYLAPDEPVTELPSLPEADDDSFMVGDLPVLRTRGAAALLADNFLDMAHFPFVHAGTFGTDEAAAVEHYDVERDDLGHRVVITHAFANQEDPGVAQGIRPLLQQRRLTYRYAAPFHLSLRIEFLDAGGTNTIGFFLCPEDAVTTRIYSSLWRDDLGDDEERMAQAIAFEVNVIEEDLTIQSRFDLLSVPLDPTVEVHVRADRTTLEMRRILAALVERAAS